MSRTINEHFSSISLPPVAIFIALLLIFLGFLPIAEAQNERYQPSLAPTQARNQQPETSPTGPPTAYDRVESLKRVWLSLNSNQFAFSPSAYYSQENLICSLSRNHILAFWNLKPTLSLTLVTLIKSPEPNAQTVSGKKTSLEGNSLFSTPDHIYLTSGLLELINCEEELAFVLAHEASHIVHEDQTLNFSSFVLTSAQIKAVEFLLHDRELRSDFEALLLTNKRYGSSSLAHYVLKRLPQTLATSSSPALNSHPGLSKRIANLDHISNTGNWKLTQ